MCHARVTRTDATGNLRELVTIHGDLRARTTSISLARSRPEAMKPDMAEGTPRRHSICRASKESPRCNEDWSAGDGGLAKSSCTAGSTNTSSCAPTVRIARKPRPPASVTALRTSWRIASNSSRVQTVSAHSLQTAARRHATTLNGKQGGL